MQQPSPCLANNSLGSASLLLKSHPGGSASAAGPSRQRSRVFPLQETCCPGVGNYHPGIVGLVFATKPAVSEPSDFMGKLAPHLQAQPGMVRRELICVRIEGVNGAVGWEHAVISLFSPPHLRTNAPDSAGP